MEVLTKKKNVVLDATLFSTFQSCERLTDLRFNHDLHSIDGKSNNLEVGSLVHKVLEVYYANLVGGIKRSDAVGNGLAAGALYISGCSYCTDFIPTSEQPKPKCGHEVGEYPGLQNTPPENQTKPKRIGSQWALQTAEQYLEYRKNDSWVPLAVEETRGRVIYEDDEIRILWKAKFDLIVDTIDYGILSVDHKTMQQSRAVEELNNQFMGQCLLMDAPRLIKNNIGFQTSLPDEKRFNRDVISYTQDQLLEWASEIVPYYAYQMIMCKEMEYYPPRFTHCNSKYGRCQFHDVCKTDRALREDELKRAFVVGEHWDP